MGKSWWIAREDAMLIVVLTITYRILSVIKRGKDALLTHESPLQS